MNIAFLSSRLFLDIHRIILDKIREHLQRLRVPVYKLTDVQYIFVIQRRLCIMYINVFMYVHVHHLHAM